jgi:hypothetical protein
MVYLVVLVNNDNQQGSSRRLMKLAVQLALQSIATEKVSFFL